MNRLILLAAVPSLSLAGHAGQMTSAREPDTAQRQITENGMHPVVSPDGRWIALGSNRDGVPDIYLTNSDGSVIVRLTADSAQEGSIAWSHDGKRVLYSVYHQDTARLFSVLTDGSGRTDIGRFPGRNPMLSPDGKKVIYAVGDWGNMQVATADLDGSNVRQISPSGAAYYNHRFSPDGALVAVSRSAPSDMQVWLLSSDGKNSRALTHFTEGRPQAAAWSPDGRQIALQGSVRDAKDPKKSIGNIWIVDVQSGKATKLAEHEEPYLDETPSWYPDGRRIAFQSNRTGRWEVWVMNSDGSDPHQITK